ncbi:DNA cytosine methyltransferase [Hymenobacter latericus]|uniref:DNA cytosine methyltransferase n=1 Tax=Hymenobacter sp. YIM 151858-1 TaxID=2987688 RepID=UPI0022277CD3|nr:DNA cytosine methyltransferase [Hymenobacter sp. YIM 151858-1]UYZ58042.1 DNA cytosine methyltransferase [Hymenobacter sp. YIM 151858-1]
MNASLQSLQEIAHQIPVLSFFTGGGLMDMGFESLGFPVVWTNEVDPQFAALYAAGMTSWRRGKDPQAGEAKITFAGSIVDIPDDDTILKQAFPAGTPNLFGIIGGPPCQDFSIAGKREGIGGQRGSLTHDYCWRIDHLQPAFFVFENVTGLLQKKHRAEFDLIRDFFKQHYLTDYAKLNSLDYGVPQSRERLFLIGIRRDLVQVPQMGLFAPELPEAGWAGWEQEFTHAEARKSYTWPTTTPLGVTPPAPEIEQQLDLCVSRCLVPEHLEETTHNAKERFNLISKKPAATDEGMVSNRSFKRLHRYRYSPTACYGNNEVHLHPWENKRLSVREVLRIQGVDEEYILPTDLPLSAKFKMIGNGVPVPLANGVARTIARLLRDYCGVRAKSEVALKSELLVQSLALAEV